MRKSRKAKDLVFYVNAWWEIRVCRYLIPREREREREREGETHIC